MRTNPYPNNIEEPRSPVAYEQARHTEGQAPEERKATFQNRKEKTEPSTVKRVSCIVNFGVLSLTILSRAFLLSEIF
jgi:hypothetical protein